MESLSPERVFRTHFSADFVTPIYVGGVSKGNTVSSFGASFMADTVISS
jgi:hypothetical protein